MSEADFAAVLRDIRAQLDRIEARVDALEEIPAAIAEVFNRAAQNNDLSGRVEEAQPAGATAT